MKQPRKRGGLRPSSGRPSKDAVDQTVVDVAAALMLVFEIGPQMARDQAIAWLEGEETDPPADLTSHSRRFRKAAAGREVHSFVLPTNNKIPRSDNPASRFEHRAKAIQRKGLRPRPEATQAYVAVLRALAAKDMPTLLHAYLRLFPDLFAKRRRPPQIK
jgi:hypothetical protein